MPNRADAVADRPAVAAPGFAGLLESWRQVVLNGNLAPGRRVDAVSRWLLITRACVFPMTLTSGAIGGLLAALSAPAPHWGYFALALLGLVIAHAANNMINDYFDTIGGIDTEAYVRTQYAPHPLFSGLVTKRGLLATIAACNLADLAIGIVLLRAWGWPVAAFALAGLFVSVFYVAPPLKLKHHGLGVGVLLVAAAIPRLRQVLKAYGEPKPAAPPPGYRVWPLWFVSLAFYHGRLAGGLFVLGLVLNALLGL